MHVNSNRWFVRHIRASGTFIGVGVYREWAV